MLSFFTKSIYHLSLSANEIYILFKGLTNGVPFLPGLPGLPSLPVLPLNPLGSTNDVIEVGQYKGSVDIEFPYYKNFTSFNVSITDLGKTARHHLFSHTNKGTLFTQDMKSGGSFLRIVGIPDTNCSLIQDQGRVRIVNIKGMVSNTRS